LVSIEIHVFKSSVDKLLAKDVSKQKITREDADTARGRITTTTKMEDLSDVDFVIEAVPVRLSSARWRDFI